MIGEPAIRELNDQCRQALGIGARIVQTAGIAALPAETRSRIREAVETFDDFTPANDPYGEHDCALLEVEGLRVIWKIDYYDPTFTMHSENPARPELTRRVLTIMLASEY